MELPGKEDLIRHIMLTNSVVWRRRLTRTQIDEWLSNFTGAVHPVEYEHQLALWLLTNFVYYNESEVKHLCKTLYNDFVHHLLLEDQSAGDIAESLRGRFARLRFNGLGRWSESSGYILYSFRQENRLRQSLFLSSSSLEALDDEGVDTIVFVDDVALSGAKGQAARYLQEQVQKHFSNKRIVVLALIASEEAKAHLESLGYVVINAVTLTNHSRAFHQESDTFGHHPADREKCHAMCMHYGKRLNARWPLGYNDGQYLFGFFHNTPNNTIPILWSELNGWKPIVNRYDKNYSRANAHELAAFL